MDFVEARRVPPAADQDLLARHAGAPHVRDRDGDQARHPDRGRGARRGRRVLQREVGRPHAAARAQAARLLLVSHSTPQILQFCERAVWLEHGAVVMDDEPLRVVKAYEEFNQRLSAERKGAAGAAGGEDAGPSTRHGCASAC
ncbi:MAG: hypothetical protein MZW92_53055 [Comamonadaceae bacterium]|nr:hypothetical protein [Comamonadaceae bacterium]